MALVEVIAFYATKLFRYFQTSIILSNRRGTLVLVTGFELKGLDSTSTKVPQEYVEFKALRCSSKNWLNSECVVLEIH